MISAGIISGNRSRPPFTKNLKVWLDALTIAQSDGTAVASWADKSGNGGDASQGTSGNRPTYKTGILNGNPVVRFDGTDDYLTGATSISGAPNLTAYGVITLQNAGGAFGRALSLGVTGVTDASTAGAAATFCRLTGLTGNADVGVFASGAQLSTATIGYATPCVFVAHFNGTNCTVYANGTAASGVAYNVNWSISNYRLGENLLLEGSWWAGDIAELLIYDVAHTSTEREKMEDYLGQKYGITIA